MAIGSLGLFMGDVATKSVAASAQPNDGDIRVEDFTIYGYKALTQGRAAEIHDMITDAELLRTIDGAPTLSIKVEDPQRVLSDMNFLSYRITMVLDTYAFELVQVKKSGDQWDLVFEDVLVAEMRRRNTARKVAPKTMSRVEFAYLLIAELPKTDFVTPGIPLSVTNVELARGKEATGSAAAQVEDTWKCLTRIFSDVQWRFWVDQGKIFASNDDYLIKLPSAGTLVEYSGAVDEINYDIDAGKPITTATVDVLAERWVLPIGARVEIGGTGPDQGSWLVSEIRRSLFSKRSKVTLVRPSSPLPEPPSQPSQADIEAWTAGVIAGKALALLGATAAGAGGSSQSQAEIAVQFALSKEGGPYVWGGTGPTGYDCSGLVQAAFREAGVQLPRVSLDQYNYCASRGGALSLAEASHVRGAILEHPPHTTGPSDSGHIAISLGTGNDTIEAMGSAYGIVRGHISGRSFTRGARVPGITY